MNQSAVLGLLLLLGTLGNLAVAAEDSPGASSAEDSPGVSPAAPSTGKSATSSSTVKSPSGDKSSDEDSAADNDADRSAAATDPAQLATWITQLSDDSYDIREQACKHLQSGGVEVVAPLKAAAEKGDLEVTSRAVRVLRQLYLTGDDNTFEAAQIALEALARSTNGVISRRAVAVLTNDVAIRQKRAVARLEALGGHVVFQESVTGVQIGQSGEPMIAHVRLDRKWKGGDKGLVQISRLANLNRLYIIRGTPVSDAALEQLRQDLPNLEVQRRGPAMIGIQGSLTENGCQVTMVAPDSPAERAQLQAGDVILKFDNQEVKTFLRLVELSTEKEIGDKVRVELRRNDEVLEVELIMAEWK